MKYFSIEELVKSASAERLAIDNTPPRAARRMLTILIEQLLDPIRRRYGAPIIVTSGYRWLHISYVPGMLRNQVIDVNVNDDVNDDDDCLSDRKLTSALSLSLKMDYQDSG
ncbi:MAG: hypothetical protein IKY72_05180 [Bacteroidaceae bacterium]|nr:hypothetical protein [Bacteroidaceae bacterium]